MQQTPSHPSSCTCDLHPYSDQLSVRVARDAYLAENGFTIEAYTDKWTKASLFGIPVAVPNTPRHQWAIKLHDLHHVATNFGTDLPGEGEISAWEWRGGLRALGLYVAGIVVSIALTGILIAPRRTRHAWRAAAGVPSLFSRSDDYDALLELSVGELRTMLGVPPGGLSHSPRKLHPRMKKAA